MATKKVKEPLHTFDAARFLKNEEEIAAYLEACLERHRMMRRTLPVQSVAVAVHAACCNWARDTGLGRESLYKALSPHGNPSLGTVMKGHEGLGAEDLVSADQDGCGQACCADGAQKRSLTSITCANRGWPPLPRCDSQVCADVCTTI